MKSEQFTDDETNEIINLCFKSLNERGINYIKISQANLFNIIKNNNKKLLVYSELIETLDTTIGIQVYNKIYNQQKDEYYKKSINPKKMFIFF